MSDFSAHLSKRIGSDLLGSILVNEAVDFENQLLTVLLSDFSMRITGYQQYNWKGEKKPGNDPKTGKYFTHHRKQVNAVFGLRYFRSDCNVIFVTEGIFDAISCMRFGNAIAVLTNNPIHLKEQFGLLGKKTVAVCQGDKAGLKLANICDDAVFLPDGEDANSLPVDELKEYLNDYL